MAHVDNTDNFSTGEVSLSDIHERDRFRLGRELARDFNQESFSSVSSRARRDDTDTLGSFDISNDAHGVSTRKMDMLQQTPTMDSRMLKEQFKDFSMAGRDDSIELGRGDKNNRGLDSLDFSSRIPFSIGGSARSERAKSGIFAGESGRKHSISSTHSDPLEYINADLSRTNSFKKKGKEPIRGGTLDSPLLSRTGSFPNIDFSVITTSTPKPRGKPRVASTSQVQPGPSKISDFVSNSGSGGSRSRFAAEIREDELSDAGSISDRPRPPASSRFASSNPAKRRTTSSTIGGTGIPRSRVVSNSLTASGKASEDLTSDLPTMIAKSRKPNSSEAVPRGFKSTETFLQELGLSGNTGTMDFQNKLNHKDLNSSRPSTGPISSDNTAGMTEQSFLLPQISDISELVSGYPGDATRFSRKRSGNLKTHKHIDSIPVPNDERALLMAMKLLQEKVAGLEDSKASSEQKYMKLEDDLRRAKTRLHQEQERVRAVEEQLSRKKSGDSAFGGSDDDDAEERVREKQKIEFKMDKLKLENTITTLQARIDNISRDLDTSKIALRHMQEERNAAVNSVALAISSNQDLKGSNEQLKNEIDRLRLEQYEQERKGEREKEEWREREERLRRRVREAREAAAVAEGVMKEAARRDTVVAAVIEASENEAAAKAAERRAKEREIREIRETKARIELEQLEKDMESQRVKERIDSQRKEFDERVQQELRRIRPDLFTARSDPLPAGAPEILRSATPLARSRKEKERAIAIPRKSKKKVVVQEPVEEDDIGGDREGVQTEGELTDHTIADDTEMSISPEEIRRIAKEINAERKKRKAAAATANQKAAVEAAQVAETRARAEAEAASKAQKKQAAKPKPKTVTRKTKPTVALETESESAPEDLPKPAERKKKVPKSIKARLLKKLEKSATTTTNGLPTPPRTTEVQIPEPAPPLTESQPLTQAQLVEKTKGRRVIKKVIYYMDEDTTRIMPLEKEVEVEEPEVVEEPQPVPEKTEEPIQETEETSELESSTSEEEEPTIQKLFGKRRNTRLGSNRAAETTTGLPERVQRVVDHLAEHNPTTCTVCARFQRLRAREEEQRLENPLADIDNSMAVPAAPLEAASTRPRKSYEEEPTLRPSVAPKKQLSRIVRQLQDEFSHLKLSYQEKAEEFMNIDPSIGKRGRKSIIKEMNELVDQMDYKCDQIYALYDVNEEFVLAPGTGFSDDDEEEEEDEEDEEDGENKVLVSEEDEEESYLDDSTVSDLGAEDETTEPLATAAVQKKKPVAKKTWTTV